MSCTYVNVFLAFSLFDVSTGMLTSETIFWSLKNMGACVCNSRLLASAFVSESRYDCWHGLDCPVSCYCGG
ncbi:hypothetical protein BJ138DRAFT_1147092 [Hygrophoropsis aurantiaca]|uniref:Uncharacterized protein n=1 Tax=Hygrophoropsis aurantiaca TaxID=72124 RepID=A0ACB8AHV5_9AGAM|nr:hypothetical protein BJ138DRAFT_1147092 [Hygrophoropsis aurantiaca]